jgi:hypothetical protein
VAEKKITPKEPAKQEKSEKGAAARVTKKTSLRARRTPRKSVGR